MTEEEKKEFEEFLQWKKDRAAKSQTMAENPGDPLLRANEEKHPKVINTLAENSGKIENDKPEVEKANTVAVAIGVLIGVVFLVVLFAHAARCGSGVKDTPAELVCDSVAVTDVPADSDIVAETGAVGEPAKAVWNITTDLDAMTDTRNIWAEITSDDYICQDFPYEGHTYASIIVRYMKKYGYDVLIQITKGQINGREYYGTNYITARFDGGSPKKYYYNEASDGSSDVVFIQYKSDFIKKCKQAKDIKIDIPIYQSGRPVFTFHVDEPLVLPKK